MIDGKEFDEFVAKRRELGDKRDVGVLFAVYLSNKTGKKIKYRRVK